MIDSRLERHPVEVLAAEFVERYRRGERPTLKEYAAEHPQLVKQIRTLFPAIALMEDFKQGLFQGSEPRSAARMPERLAEYRILREVGRGGMGIVYEAEQESLGRRVAVKVLTAQALLNANHLRRFHREAQAMARLHHTNIIPVFGVGEHEGLPYFVMQFIEGRGLDQVVAEWKTDNKPEAPAKPSLPPPIPHSPKIVARIGLQAAEALHYAHGQGTLHRDIKPSNLLLDGRGVVWVTDFGLAKLLALGDVTRTGEMAGTLRYMAPERFEGRADSRSDVYSLGLTLYELLTLRPAFDEADHGPLVRQVTQHEPPAPRRLAPGTPRDLETVVRKATARDPAHRYRTAGELADDLRRFLEDKPVRARPAGAPERLWRWCRRNPPVAALVGVAAGQLLLVAVVASAGYLRTEAALQREASLRAEAEEQRRGAETNLRLVQAAAARETEQRREVEGQRQRAETNLALALRAFETIFAQTTHRELLPPSEPGTEDDEIEPPLPPSVTPETAALLHNLLKFYEQFGERNRSDPRLRREIAKAHRCVGDIQQRLGQFDEAEAAYRRALDLLSSERGTRNAELSQRSEFRAPSSELEMAVVQNELGLVLQMTGRPAEAEKLHRQALETLQAQVRRAPLSARGRHDLARTYNLLGSLVSKAGRRDEGENHHRRALELLEELLDEDPDNPDYRFALARSFRNLFTALSPRVVVRPPDPRAGGRPPDRAAVAESTAAYRKAITILEALAEDFPDVPDYRHELSEVLLLVAPGERAAPRGKLDEQRLRRALDLAKELAVAFPAVPQYQALRARAYQRLGSSLQASGRSYEAEPFHREAVALHRSLVGRFPSVPVYQLYLSEACQSLGTILLHRHEWAETSSLLREAVEAQQAYVKATPGDRAGQLVLARQYQSLAEALRRQGEQAQAEEAARKAEKARKGL